MINKQLSFLEANSILKQSLTKDLQKKSTVTKLLPAFAVKYLFKGFICKYWL